MEEAEELAYDDPRSDSDVMVMGADGSQGPELSLCDEATDSLPNTSRSLALRWGCQWSTCHHWRLQLLAGMQSRCTSMRRS